MRDCGNLVHRDKGTNLITNLLGMRYLKMMPQHSLNGFKVAHGAGTDHFVESKLLVLFIVQRIH
jgi:hypothetical protein